MNQTETLKVTGHLLNRPPRPPKKRKPLPRQSKKRATQMKEYLKRRKVFLGAHPYCQIYLAQNQIKETEIFEVRGVMGDRGIVRGIDPKDGFSLYTIGLLPLSTEIHHRAGRIGEKLLDEKDWLAVSRGGHWFVHQHPKEARALNLLK